MAFHLVGKMRRTRDTGQSGAFVDMSLVFPASELCVVTQSFKFREHVWVLCSLSIPDGPTLVAQSWAQFFCPSQISQFDV